MFKRFEFEGIQIYCDDERQRVANKALGRCYCTAISDWGEWYHAMRQRVRGGCVEKSTVFGPVSGSVDMAMVFKSFIKEMVDTPYVDLHAKLASINTSLTRDQYTTLVKTVSTLTNWTEVSSLTAIRPKVPVKGNAKVWWRFVGRAVRQAVTKERSDKLLAKISEVLKPEYQALYSDVVHKVPFNADKERAYRFACRFMTVPDMVWCRRQVYAQLAQELKTKRKDTDDVAAAAVVESETTPRSQEGRRRRVVWLV
ncbi:Vacuolar sorting-associated protein 13, N-terminal, putative [Angomonas deanei]|uniref:Vacuolar sorting-associated protein 13, N-terminal, putative n=1 Tax=Angomonas deanei TaxID=59799 RepID=A0A7G2C493_9TRYP|nr:Vacuolar sorting-associated protein 13, N-terminal, putative [Angomonas deanei]